MSGYQQLDGVAGDSRQLFLNLRFFLLKAPRRDALSQGTVRRADTVDSFCSSPPFHSNLSHQAQAWTPNNNYTVELRYTVDLQ